MYFQKTPYKPKTINSNLDTIPWEECWRLYKEAADNAVESYQLALEQQYNKQYNQRKSTLLQQLGVDESEASFEGELPLEYNPPQLDPLLRRKLRNRAGNEAIREYFVKPYQLKSWGVKVLDQAVALYSRHKLNSLGSGGTISGLKYLQDNIDPNNPRELGLLRFLLLDSRSDYLEKMASGEAKKYCTLVPLVLYAHKLYSGVDYAQWDRETLQFVVNDSLCEAMLTQMPELSRERLLELRDIGIMQKGEKRNPATTYSLYRLGDTELAHCNSLAKIMALQTWAAHPSNRTKYMVLDPMDWDSMPPPLVDVNVFKVPETALVHERTKPSSLAETHPWL